MLSDEAYQERPNELQAKCATTADESDVATDGSRQPVPSRLKARTNISARQLEHQVPADVTMAQKRRKMVDVLRIKSKTVCHLTEWRSPR
jgi:hypothetical protein